MLTCRYFFIVAADTAGAGAGAFAQTIEMKLMKRVYVCIVLLLNTHMTYIFAQTVQHSSCKQTVAERERVLVCKYKYV